MVVLHEEYDRRLSHRREDQGLVVVALSGATVTGERHHRGVALGVTGADVTVPSHPHGIAGGVQHLVADDDRVEVEVVFGGVPAAMVDPAKHAEQIDRVHTLAPRDAVLAIAREGVVLASHGPPRTDLGGLLAEQRGP